MTIRIKDIPDKLIAITTGTKIATEDIADENNKTKGIFLPNLIPIFQTPILQNVDANNKNYSNLGTLNGHTLPGGTDVIALLVETQTLSNKTLDTPTIANYSNANHSHENTAGGGTLSKTAVGLSNVDNTSDADKPISTIQQTALDDKEDLVNKNAINGYAGLNGSSKLTGSQQVYGTTSNTAAQGNDSRLSDDRTPLSHATSHKQGGSDAIKLDELATPDDNTNLDATTSLHGLFSKVDKSKLDSLETLFTWAASDENSPLPPNGTELYTTEPADKDRNITNVIAGLKNAATGNDIAIEIGKETGVNTNIFTLGVAFRIDINDFTSQTSSFTPSLPVLWQEGRRLKIVLIEKDTNNAATGLKVTLVA